PQRLRVNLSLWLASGAIGAEFSRARLVENGLGDDRACGVAGAKEKNVVDVRHGIAPFAWEDSKAAGLRRPARRFPGGRRSSRAAGIARPPGIRRGWRDTRSTGCAARS